MIILCWKYNPKLWGLLKADSRCSWSKMNWLHKDGMHPIRELARKRGRLAACQLFAVRPVLRQWSGWCGSLSASQPCRKPQLLLQGPAPATRYFGKHGRVPEQLGYLEGDVEQHSIRTEEASRWNEIVGELSRSWGLQKLPWWNRKAEDVARPVIIPRFNEKKAFLAVLPGPWPPPNVKCTCGSSPEGNRKMLHRVWPSVTSA